METEKVVRLFQPNLTCAFDLTKNDEGYVWTLIIRNHDKAGITDEQLITQVWDFANVFTKRLIDDKMWDIAEGQPVPPVNVLMTHCSRHIMYNIIVASENAERLSPAMVVLVLAEFAKQFAERNGIKLTGLENGAKTSRTYRN